MSVQTLAAWALGRRPGMPFSPARPTVALASLRRRLGWAAAAAAAFAALGAAAGATLSDRPTVVGAFALVATVAMVPVVFRRFAHSILARLEAAVRERETLEAELEVARQTMEELRGLAYHDALTGLPNRSLLYDRLAVAISHCHRQAGHLAVLFLDLDGFKDVNDSFGHAAGDRLLAELAVRLRGSVRAGDTVARFGGDEFVVLLNEVSGIEDAARVAEKVLDAVRAPLPLEGRELHTTASVGVSVYPFDGTSPDELMRSADAAMYRDKRQQAASGESIEGAA